MSFQSDRDSSEVGPNLFMTTVALIKGDRNHLTHPNNDLVINMIARKIPTYRYIPKPGEIRASLDVTSVIYHTMELKELWHYMWLVYKTYVKPSLGVLLFSICDRSRNIVANYHLGGTHKSEEGYIGEFTETVSNIRCNADAEKSNKLVDDFVTNKQQIHITPENLLNPTPKLPFVPEDDEVVVIDSQGVVHGSSAARDLLGGLSKIRDRAGEY